MDIDVAMIGHAFEFWEVCQLSVDFLLCSKDDKEWFLLSLECGETQRSLLYV